MTIMFKTRKELIKYIKALEEQITMLVKDDKEQQETIVRLSVENEKLRKENNKLKSKVSKLQNKLLQEEDNE